MKIFNRKWIRINASKVERASRSFMQARRLLYILGILSISSASAQTVLELFNPAACEYILGNTAVASNLVTQALGKYPADERLQKLKALIEQQQEKNEQDKKNQDEKKKEEKQQDQPSDKSDKSDPSDQENDPKEQEQEQEPQEADPSPAPPQQAGEMSQEEAEQLLDAMKQNEKDQRTNLRPYLGKPVRVDKDW